MALRLGILQTDSVRPEFQPAHGDYPAMFESLFTTVDPSLEFVNYPVQERAPQAIECDAYVITGSRHSVYDDLPWIPPLVDFVREALAAGRQVIGICFGHQLMAHFFGGSVAPASVGWAVGVHRSRIVHAAPWLPQEISEFGILSSHQDQVVELPREAVLYATNEFCPIGGFRIEDQVVTVQGHPEFAVGYAADLLHQRREQLGEDVFSRGVQSLGDEIHGVTVARWLLDFVAHAR